MSSTVGGHERLRWVSSFLTVLAVHLLLVALAQYWQRQPPAPVPALPPQLVSVEFAEQATAPPAAPSDLAPGPLQQETVQSRPEPAPRKQAEPAPVLPPSPPLPTAQAAVEADADREVPAQDAPSEATVATAPPQSAATQAGRYAAPQSSVGVANAAFADWQSRLLGHLERFKRYPRAAQRRHYEGVVQVRYTVDRQGNVLAVQLAQASGRGPLDEEALAAVQRASPLPPPPPHIHGERVEVTTPIQFQLH